MEAALAAQLFIRLPPNLAGYIFVIRASDAVLPIFDILGVGGHLGPKRGPPTTKTGTPGGRKPHYCIKKREDRVTSPYSKDVPYKFLCQSDE